MHHHDQIDDDDDKSNHDDQIYGDDDCNHSYEYDHDIIIENDDDAVYLGTEVCLSNDVPVALATFVIADQIHVQLVQHLQEHDAAAAHDDYDDDDVDDNDHDDDDDDNDDDVNDDDGCQLFQHR